ncbi:MAG: DUF2225 domain-containing protein [Chitinispirillaceae bacterium]|nr:DUF2225 domain-containing protein [Chitinispirillaceae bacterium]
MTIDVVEVKRRLLALLNDSNLVNEYVRQYGPSIDIKNIKAIKEAKKRNSVHLEGEGIGEDPIYQIKVKCPVCNQENINCYELRAKSQQILQNKFLVPVYIGTSGFKTLDYTLLSVTVCPRCLFASSDKKDFYRHDNTSRSEIKTQLTSNVILTLQEKIGERKALLKTVTDYESHFKRPRTYESAIDSYRMCCSRAKVEAWYEQPNALYKLGAYTLRIAKIMKDASSDNTETFREALGYFEEAFKTSNCPTEEIEMQVIYLITVLYLKLGDFKKANSYIGVFNNLHNARNAEMRENPKLNTVIIDKWADKAKYLWEDRDRSDLFIEE